MNKYALGYLIVSIALLQSFRSAGQDTARLSFASNVPGPAARRIQAEYLYYASKDGAEKVRYAMEVAESYKQEEQFPMALAEIDSLLKDTALIHFINASRFYEINIQRALCLFLTDNCEEASKCIRSLMALYPDSLYSRQMTQVFVLSLNHLEDYSGSQKGLTDYLIHHHLDTSGVSGKFREATSARYRSVKKARNLARFLPGAGFVYINEPGKGLTSLALNAGFLTYAGFSIYSGYYVTALFTGVGQWMRFHSGGVKASASLAKQQNAKTKKSHLQVLDDFCLQKM